MEDILSFLLVILIFAAVSSSARKKAKQQKVLKQPGRTAPKAAGPAPQPAPAPASPVPKETHSHPEPREDVYQGSLGFSSMEGVDPCHDDPLSIPAGSLRTDMPEGTDPCHDDPYSMPLGSLAVDYPEGTDPCHPAPGADHPDSGVSSGAQSSGLNLRFGSSDIVQGFVWGEILNRKRA